MINIELYEVHVGMLRLQSELVVFHDSCVAYTFRAKCEKLIVYISENFYLLKDIICKLIYTCCIYN